MKNIKLYKFGFESVSPYECELEAYKKDGWSEDQPKPELPAKAKRPEQSTKTINTKKEI